MFVTFLVRYGLINHVKADHGNPLRGFRLGDRFLRVFCDTVKRKHCRRKGLIFLWGNRIKGDSQN